MEAISNAVSAINGLVWGPPMLVLILGVGLFLSLGLKLMPILRLGEGFRLMWQGRTGGDATQEGEIPPFQALMTALSATIGTGNIAGVATAVFLGGPGALFWMWLTALVGMATKYSEAVLAVNFREVDERGAFVGGPMYYIRNGLGKKWAWLGVLFAIFAAIAGFGIGNTVQANSVADVLQTNFALPHWLTGLILMVLVGLVLIGGIRRIGQVAIRFGVARGIFSNEAGLGSAPIAHAAAQTRNPINQGMVAMLGTFIDTIIVCTITGMVIISSGAWTSGESGAALTSNAFALGFPGGNYVVAIALAVFAFTTILGWSFYGERCVEFLFGVKAIVPYRVLWILAIPVGATLNLGFVWLLADTLNAMMALPNLVALVLLSPVVFRLTREHFENQRRVGG